MKKFMWTLGVFVLFIAFNSCGPTPNDAVEYNDKIIAQQNRIVKKEDAFLTALEGSAADMKAAYDSLIGQVAASISATAALGEFDGKKDFMDASIKMLNLYKGVVETDYKVLVDILSKSQDEITDADQETYNAAIQSADEKLKKANQDLEDAQNAFSKAYKFDIDPTKVVE